MNIYQTQTHPKFKPTYLCIKQHSVTGMLYFCKTVKPEKIMLQYKGSGDYWLKHLRNHGPEHVTTLWYCLFTDRDELTQFALMCSEQWDIVSSRQWANCKPENGLDGNLPGSIRKKSTIEKANATRFARGTNVVTAECIAKRLATKIKNGTENSITPESVAKQLATKIKNGTLNSNSPSSIAKNIATRKRNYTGNSNNPSLNKQTCPHCGKLAGAGMFARWHGDQCKLR